MFTVGNKVGQYEILARLKEGGMATLFVGQRAGAAGFARKVAIKIVHPDMAGNQEFVRMFVDEAFLSARIHHPNVVHVEELGEADGTYYLVMEYVEGCSLAQLLDALIRKGRRMSPELAVWIAIEVADGLHAAHETRNDQGELLNVVHRDVSPQNVLVADRGNVKLIDFGIAKARIRGRRTTVGSLKGKLRYMAPEQAFGRAVDRRTDVYALGIVLWEMLTLRQLFDGRNDLEVMRMVQNPVVPPPGLSVPGIPEALDRVVLSALAKSADERPQGALELRRRLAEAMPQAAALDFSDMAELLAATMNDETGGDASDATAAASPSMTDQATVVHRKRGSLRPGRSAQDALKKLTLEAMAIGVAKFSAETTPGEASPEVDAVLAATVPPEPPAPQPIAARPSPETRVSQASPRESSEPGQPRRSRSSVMEARIEDVQAATAAHMARTSREPVPPTPAEEPPRGLWAKLKRLLS